MDRVGRLLSGNNEFIYFFYFILFYFIFVDISMHMSHLLVNPNLYPQLLLGYNTNVDMSDTLSCASGFSMYTNEGSIISTLTNPQHNQNPDLNLNLLNNIQLNRNHQTSQNITNNINDTRNRGSSFIPHNSNTNNSNNNTGTGFTNNNSTSAQQKKDNLAKENNINSST